MSNPTRVSNEDCLSILDFIRSKLPPQSPIVINLAVAQGQEDVFYLQTIRNVEVEEAVDIMLDSAKSYINNRTNSNENENTN